MNGPVSKLGRAIYTRSRASKPDLAFTSLDARAEACEHPSRACTTPMTVAPGLAGAAGSAVADIAAGKIDIVVVYGRPADPVAGGLAVDCCSMPTVWFVAVTQQPTTTRWDGSRSISRCPCQFEREVIGERVRDKSRPPSAGHPGRWSGPLGYAADNAIVVAAEPRRYRSLRAIWQWLCSRSLTTSIGEASAASRGSFRTAAIGGGSSGWGRWPICSRTGSTSVRWLSW